MISLNMLQAIYGVVGARDAFEHMCSLLIKTEYPEARVIRVFRGDGGVDTSVGDYFPGTAVTVFQQKCFLTGISEAQKNQIRESYATAAANQNFQLAKWVLCIPAN